MLCSKTGRFGVFILPRTTYYIDITSDLKMANSHRQPVYAYCVVHIRILPCDIYFHIHYLNAQISL